MPENEDHEPPEHDATGPSTPAQSALERAAAHLCGSLRTDGSHAGRAEDEWRDLLKWAASKKLILPVDYESPARSETAEHDVRYEGLAQRWFKYTIPGHCGFTVDCDGNDDSEPTLRLATPSEYLSRLIAQNKLFVDDILLIGLWHDQSGGGWRIVTSQPDIPGEPATRIQILDGMMGYGFKPLAVSGVNAITRVPKRPMHRVGCSPRKFCVEG